MWSSAVALSTRRTSAFPSRRGFVGTTAVLAVFKGPDVGEFGQAPFQELAKDLNTGKQIEMFVDARAVPQASLDVSSDWAQWMIANDKSLIRINMLCATPFVQLTARIVRNLTTFGERMRIYTEAGAFEQALGTAIVGIAP